MIKSFRNGDIVEYVGTHHNDKLEPGVAHTVKDMVGALHGGNEGPLTIRLRLEGFDVLDTFHPNDFRLTGE